MFLLWSQTLLFSRNSTTNTPPNSSSLPPWVALYKDKATLIAQVNQRTAQPLNIWHLRRSKFTLTSYFSFTGTSSGGWPTVSFSVCSWQKLEANSCAWQEKWLHFTSVILGVYCQFFRAWLLRHRPFLFGSRIL